MRDVTLFAALVAVVVLFAVVVCPSVVLSMRRGRWVSFREVSRVWSGMWNAFGASRRMRRVLTGKSTRSLPLPSWAAEARSVDRALCALGLGRSVEPAQAGPDLVTWIAPLGLSRVPTFRTALVAYARDAGTFRVSVFTDDVVSAAIRGGRGRMTAAVDEDALALWATVAFGDPATDEWDAAACHPERLVRAAAAGRPDAPVGAASLAALSLGAATG